jgi:hypothetical protein
MLQCLMLHYLVWAHAGRLQLGPGRLLAPRQGPPRGQGRTGSYQGSRPRVLCAPAYGGAHLCAAWHGPCIRGRQQDGGVGESCGAGGGAGDTQKCQALSWGRQRFKTPNVIAVAVQGASAHLAQALGMLVHWTLLLAAEHCMQCHVGCNPAVLITHRLGCKISACTLSSTASKLQHVCPWMHCHCRDTATALGCCGLQMSSCRCCA